MLSMACMANKLYVTAEGLRGNKLSVLLLQQGLGGRGPSPASAATPPHSAFATPPHQTSPAEPSQEAQRLLPWPPAVKDRGQSHALVASGQVAGPIRASTQQPLAVGAAAVSGVLAAFLGSLHLLVPVSGIRGWAMFTAHRHLQVAGGARNY